MPRNLADLVLAMLQKFSMPLMWFRSVRKFVFAVMVATMLLVAKIQETGIGIGSVRIYNRINPNSFPDNRHQFFHRAVFDNLRVHFPFLFNESENNSLSSRAQTSDTSHSTCPKVTFIDFIFALSERTDELAEFRDPITNRRQSTVDRIATDSGQNCNLRGFHIQGKTLQ
jgi:hypothetical protein